MFHKSKLMFWTSEVLLLTIIFFIWRQMGDMVTPIVSVVNTILIPFLVGGFLYYITNPLVKFLQDKLKINRMIGILITLSLLFGLIALGVIYLLPILINQLSSLINSTQGLYWEIQSFVNQLSKNPLFRNLNIQSTIQQLNLSYVDILQNILNSVTNSLGSVLSAVVNTLMILIMTPIFLVYFLMDGHKLLPMLERTVLKRDKLNISSLLTNLNATVARYISGISIDALIIGALAYIGYSVIGLKYALVFAIFSSLANLIPYVGPSIGLIPMVITYAFTDPQKMVAALIYMLIIQQVDGNILYPRIVGGVMKVHPITIMVLLLLSSNIYGVLGMIVAIPTYSILKEIAKFLANLYDNHKEAQQQKKNEEFGIINK
ncbi:AI-2E family transporter [Streptococcus sanguinis]|jgi:permease, putative|uniref:Permease n=1 Tax=Streptococcus sanguinis SK330 TaxID=888813 RepID=F2C4S3_STRSA|nr:AI-2E family transporter [Streptococcus sanguinis]EGF15906.1 permease [Streptococcus sanguinis SK330]MCY7028883.1 AI-2E family transporter [Streptococcus sanguinis]MCY7032752.1 AI-2E family transporter [Streptococcus sanguinis]RSI21870.1 AI-2 transport protein TqsA [Streptococcus sanguinis]RSI47958.1 AI-2 transport protein TqsA [Streptococcus sanguinis]